MPVLKPKPTLVETQEEGFNVKKLIYDYSIVSVNNYKTTGEKKLIIRDVDECEIIIDEEKTKEIFIKSFSKTLIKTESLIDEEYNELLLNKGACVHMSLIRNVWYILSSDGIKRD